MRRRDDGDAGTTLRRRHGGAAAHAMHGVLVGAVGRSRPRFQRRRCGWLKCHDGGRESRRTRRGEQAEHAGRARRRCDDDDAATGVRIEARTDDDDAAARR